MAPTTRRGPNTPVNDTNPNNMTPESVQAMIDQALLRNSTNGDGSHSSHRDNRRNMQTARPCFYADFMKCQPLNFKGAEGVVGLTRWIEKMESIFNISGCAVENQVKFATCTLLGAALTWWNGQIRTLGPEAYAMTWEVLKRKMTDKYCPQGEIKKLEIELWNLKVKGNDVPAYTERFQELTLICTKFVANETEKVYKYLSGLPDNIYGNVKAAKPKTLDETIELANDTWTCRKEALWGILAQVQQVPSPPQWPVHPEVPQVQQDRALCSRLQETLKRDVQKLKKMGEMGNAQGWVMHYRWEYLSQDRTQFLRVCKREESRLRLSMFKAQEYMAKGCQVFLAQISAKKEEDKSERKQIEDVPIVRDFPEVFPEDLPGLPPARPVEFQIDLVPGAAPVARAPYRLAPSEHEELYRTITRAF
ncbi:putative reverse transcriptase domain-containing protein [Tanacetum coccineum]